MRSTPTPEQVIESVSRWVWSFVVGMNLCPFARKELDRKRVRFTVTEATGAAELLTALEEELALLDRDTAVATTLLIHPHALPDFLDYNEFLDEADDLLRALDREGVYQIASFHPCYQFHETEPDDAENYTNRSPYPMLHLLREDSVEAAVADHPDIEQIPVRNTEHMNKLGGEQLSRLWRECFAG